MITILTSIICVTYITGLQANGQSRQDLKNGLLFDVEGVRVDYSSIWREYRPKSSSRIQKPDLPAHFDTREFWPECPSIWMIWDQGRCGSCWAFGSTMAMSDRLCIQSWGAIKAILSVQDLLTCCEECAPHAPIRGGCQGGYPDKAWEFWNKEGIVTGGSFESQEGCQPYSFGPCTPEHNPCHEYENRPETTPACKQSCRNEYPLSYENDKFFGQEPKLFTNEWEIMDEIMNHGPVSAGMGIYADFLNYTGGIYVKKSDEYQFGHLIRLIGWGEENGTPYWIGANSWNSFWGEDGFFRIRRGTNEAGIERMVMAADPDFKRSTAFPDYSTEFSTFAAHSP